MEGAGARGRRPCGRVRSRDERGGDPRLGHGHGRDDGAGPPQPSGPLTKAERPPFDPAGWTQDATGAWTRELHRRRLRVTPDPDAPDEPWIWEVLRIDDN